MSLTKQAITTPSQWEEFSFFGNGGVDGGIIESLVHDERFDFTEVRLHLSSIHASKEDFVVRLSSINGSRHNIVLLSQDMENIQDLVFQPDQSMNFLSGDQLVFSLVIGSGTNNWGLNVKGWSVLG